MKRLLLYVAPPGAGKSTRCKNTSITHTRISQDDQGKKEHMKLFNEAIERGDRDIIVDRMNFNKAQRDRYLLPAKKAGYKTTIAVLHVPLQVCLDRCNQRTDHPTIKDSKTASKAVNFFFKNYERVQDDEADYVLRVGWIDDSVVKKPIIVCDIDGTMADIEHRRKHLIPKEGKKRGDWGAFFRDMVHDDLNEWCAKITNTFALNGTPIVFATGRPDEYKQQTVRWLYENKLMSDHLFMRGRGDYRKDDIVKEIILEWEIKTRYSNVLFVIDDRPSVCRMWRRHGLTVLQCQDEEF